MKTHTIALSALLALTAWACGSAPIDAEGIDNSSVHAVEDGGCPFDIDGDGELNRYENRLQYRYTHEQMGECRAALGGQLDQNGDGNLEEGEQTRARERLHAWLEGECPFDGECGCQADQEMLQQRTQNREQARLHEGEACDCEPAHNRQQDRDQIRDGEQNGWAGCDEPPCGDGETTQQGDGTCEEPPCGDGEMVHDGEPSCDEPPCGDGEMNQDGGGECAADTDAV